MKLRLTGGIRKIGATVLLCLGVAFLSTDFSIQDTPLLKEGAIASQNIVATQSFEYLDLEETERLRAELRENPHAVYQLDVTSSPNIQYRIGSAFREARKQRGIPEINPENSNNSRRAGNKIQIFSAILEQINLRLMMLRRMLW